MVRVQNWKQFVAAAGCVVVLNGCSAFRPKTLGVTNGRLYPCPPAPKCVSSYAPAGRHHIEPLPFAGNLAATRERVLRVLAALEDTTVVVKEPRYIRAEARVKAFIDDVEFYLDEEQQVVHFTSSARTGYWDWNKNRSRAEQIRQLYRMKDGNQAFGN